MPTEFNDLLTGAGINPSDVCVIRHHTPESGKNHATLHDLWRDDPAGFSRYQASQEAGRPIFRKRKIWAAFVCPEKGETMFVGLFDAELAETRKADWLCDYRGDAPGFGEPIDIFSTHARPELAHLSTSYASTGLTPTVVAGRGRPNGSSFQSPPCSRSSLACSRARL